MVVTDARSLVEYRRFTLPAHTYPLRLRPNGDLLYFRLKHATLDRAQHTLTALNLITGVSRDVVTVDGYVDFGFALSPDGNKVAYSVRAPGSDEAGGGKVEVRLLDLSTGADRAAGIVGGEAFEVFSGSATVVAWRGDGWLSVVGAKRGGQPMGYALLNTVDGATVFNEPGYAIASPLGRWRVYADINGVGSVMREPQRIRVVDPLTNVEVNRIEDAEKCLVPLEWAPDDSELLIRKGAPNPYGEPGCDVMRATYLLLRPDGSPAEPVADPSAVWFRWYADRLAETRCLDAPGVREASCSDSDLLVNGHLVASGFIDVLGWIEP